MADPIDKFLRVTSPASGDNVNVKINNTTPISVEQATPIEIDTTTPLNVLQSAEIEINDSTPIDVNVTNTVEVSSSAITSIDGKIENPMPVKNKDETTQEFVSRCMKELEGEFTDERQRAAVCFRQAKEPNSSMPSNGK